MMGWVTKGKGWNVVDGVDGASLCGVSVSTGSRTDRRPLVHAAAHAPRTGAEQADGALQDLLDQLGRQFPALVTLPRERYRLRVMAEPAVPPREMLNSLRWALSTEADAGGLDEFNLAWMPIPVEAPQPGRSRQVYTVQTPSAWLTERMAAWKPAGLRPKVVDIRETALRNIAGALERGNEGLALLAHEADGICMVFVHHGSLFLDRFIELPLLELRGTEAPGRARLFERVAVQLMRSVDIISRTYPFMPVQRVVVAPSPEELGLFPFLQQQLPLAVEKLDLARVFNLARVPDLAGDPALQSRCLVALGAALRAETGAAA